MVEQHSIMMVHLLLIFLIMLVKHHGPVLMEDIVKFFLYHHIKMGFRRMHLEVCLTWQQMQIHTVAILFVFQLRRVILLVVLIFFYKLIYFRYQRLDIESLELK